MIIGTGIDIVDVPRIKTLLDRDGERFLHRWFSDAEIEYCASKAEPCLHLAARFAAKEATFKALRLPGSLPLCWKDIVVRRGGDGAPFLDLHGEPRQAAERMGVERLHLSLSHCDSFALASVTAEGPPV
jgi:holo-[acyl-carrier protein] synthase